MKNLKTKTVAGVIMNINIEAIAKGLHQMHVDIDQEALISFGMLSAPIMEAAKTSLTESTTQKIDEELSKLDNILALVDTVAEPERFNKQVNDFVNECMKDITVCMYGLVKMVV